LARSIAQSCSPITGVQYLTAWIVFSLAYSASSVHAGAWTPDKGHKSAIVTVSVSQTPVAERAITTDLYYEHGLGRGWTLVLAPSVSDQDNVFARNEAQASLRRAIYQGGGWAISGQVGVYIWKESETRLSSSGTEARLAVGKSFGNGGWANIEAALRGCGGTNSLRWEGTLGHKVRNNDKAIIKIFGDSEGCAANITRVQASYVYGLTSNLGIELGWRQTLPNKENWQEKGAILGFWIAF
jgi:hypothetical protein